MWRKAHHEIGCLPEHKDNALAQAIGPIGDHQISCLQLKDFQVFSLLPIGYLELGQATRKPNQRRYAPARPSLGLLGTSHGCHRSTKCVAILPAPAMGKPLWKPLAPRARAN